MPKKAPLYEEGKGINIKRLAEQHMSIHDMDDHEYLKTIEEINKDINNSEDQKGLSARA